MSDLETGLRAALQARPPQRVAVEGSRDAAVLIPIVAETEPQLIFTARTETVGSHKGQISFPGGAIEAGESPEAAALREAEEELGIDARSVRVLGALDAVPTYVSGYVIVPVIGWLDHRPVVTPNPEEVAAVLEVPLADLSDDLRIGPGFSHAGRTYPTEGWIWKDHVIWGATARILGLFLSRAAESGAATLSHVTGWSKEGVRFS